MSSAPAQLADSIQWHAFRSAEAGIAFQYPPGFTITNLETNAADCNFVAEFARVRYDTVGTVQEMYGQDHPEVDDGDRVLVLERPTHYTLTLSNQKLVAMAREAGFEQHSSGWRMEANPYQSMPSLEAELIDHRDWIGMRSLINVRYNYASGGVATAAGEGYRYFAAKQRDAHCTAFVTATEFELTGGTHEFSRIVSSIEFLNEQK